MKHLFRNDYSEFCHERIYTAIGKCLQEQNIGYGLDKHSLNAEKLIKKVFDAKVANVHFLSGGTQANMTVISFLLRDYEGVIACNTGHINVHETASVEGSGHKVFTVDGKNGKVYPEDIISALKFNTDEHMVKIKMVYISNSTEIGTVYTKEELQNLYACCKQNGLYLFIDGARLGVALTSNENDVTPEIMSKVCDVFYVGGTKNGLLSGEAVVIVNKKLQKEFRYQIKNKGAMLAKGFVLGVQFEELFKDGLYFELASNSNKMAQIIKGELLDMGYDVAPSPTNQLFVTMDKQRAKLVMDNYGCELWKDLGDKQMIRIVTSFATKQCDVDNFVKFMEKIKG